MQSLNPQQQAAVTELDCPLLVLAGAGSGKTRVITEKIVYLIKQGIAPQNISAITFTNKAAREMRARIGKLLDASKIRGLRVSTFHAFGLDILKAETKTLNFKSSISIFDQHDRTGLVSDLVSGAVKKPNPEETDKTLTLISQWKNSFTTPEQAIATANSDHAPAARLYLDYNQKLEAYNAVDFDDLIFRPVKLFSSHPKILEKWQNRIRYLLVDEYQDTNLTQYQLVRLLVGKIGKFTIVGDDDQSIYAWRGAHPENLARLKTDFPQLKVTKLEQNYRSSGRILKAANRLIENNPHVFEKKLWSTHGPGTPLRVLSHRDDISEAQQVASEIIHHKFKQGNRYRNYAVLYRSNHQSRPVEKALREYNIPYFLSGGRSFFDQTEIRDILAYLRLACNPDDDRAFLRVVNIPRREIGPATLEKLSQYANRRRTSLLFACSELGLQKCLSPRAVGRLAKFCEQIAVLAACKSCPENFPTISCFVEDIRYTAWLKEISPSLATARRKSQNVQDLMNWLKNLSNSGDAKLTLTETIQKVILLEMQERNEEENDDDRVHLMTLHAAKGLEFPFVHLIGMEENLLPHQSSIDSDNVEEERRLAYVGITRAEKNITLHYCTHRKRFGEVETTTPSRFLDELPPEDLEWPSRRNTDPEKKKAAAQANLAQLKNLLSGN